MGTAWSTSIFVEGKTATGTVYVRSGKQSREEKYDRLLSFFLFHPSLDVSIGSPGQARQPFFFFLVIVFASQLNSQGLSRYEIKLKTKDGNMCNLTGHPYHSSTLTQELGGDFRHSPGHLNSRRRENGDRNRVRT